MAAKDFVVQAMIFLLILNAMPGVMEASGLNDAMGVDVNLGIDDTYDSLKSNIADGFSPNTGIVESFVSVTIAAGQVVKLLFQSITAFPALLKSLGAPGWLTTPLEILMSLISTLGVIYVATGRRFGR